MFKTLFTTILLICSLGTPSLKYETPKKLNYTTIQGAYTFQDTFDYDTFFDVVDMNDDYVEIEIINQENNINVYGVQSGVYLGTQTPSSFYVSYDTNHRITFTLANDSDSYWLYLEYSFEPVEDIDDYLSINVPSYVVQNFVVSFRNSIALDNQQRALFNLLFTKGGNRYVTYYDGYYHFNSGNWYSTNGYNFDYMYGCYFMTNEGIFNCYSQNSPSYLNTVIMYSRYYDSENQAYSSGGVTFYSYGTYKSSPNIMITGLLPKSVRDKLTAQGVFQFVPDTQGSTWYEMILSTMDAPLYYLHGLLGFELFGINLFVAFSSLLTLVIIITVIKKVT